MAPGHCGGERTEGGDDRVGAGERGSAQRIADLWAQPAAADEKQPVDALGKLTSGQKCDTAAKAVPGHGKTAASQRQDQISQHAGVAPSE